MFNQLDMYGGKNDQDILAAPGNQGGSDTGGQADGRRESGGGLRVRRPGGPARMRHLRTLVIG